MLSNDGIPVVGEIKAKTDVDMFTALVQALVYAVELSSSSQRNRLIHAYPKFRKTGLKIFLIYEEAGDDKDNRLRISTKDIAVDLLKDSECKDFITQIALIKCKRGDDGEPHFDLDCQA